MRKFFIPQVESDEVKEEKLKAKENEKASEYKREQFVSPYYGTKVKDEITITGAKYGNKGMQYDSFRDKDKRIRKDDYKDYVTFREIEQKPSRLTEEERKTPSYLIKDPLYKDIMQPSIKEDDTFVRASESNIVREKVQEIRKPIAPSHVDLDEIEEPKETYKSFDDIVQEYNQEEYESEYDDIQIEYEEDKKKAYLDEEVIEEEKVEEVKPKPIKKESKPTKKRRSRYVAPPLSLLKRSDCAPLNDMSGVHHQRQGIDKILADFKVAGRVVNYTKGPAVTQFEVQLDPGVKMQSVSSIASNIQAELQAKTIRVQAPIPGKSTVGIEVPNQVTEVVYFGDMISNKEFLNDNNPLNVVLGLDLSGKQVNLDISKAPHVLIAGTTGSGKSVCINCIINSILYKAHPDDVKLVLVDPKIIEFSNYEEVPHLAMPIITDAKTAQMAMKWAVDEMEHRYQMLKPYRVSDIKEYNKLASNNLDMPHLPFIVIVVDELADLVATSSSDTLEYIQRITQKGRAAGIHMILATQRPSVNIINGTIKSNTPIRIAFAVKAQVDSGVILDHVGAEKLLGNGDMLYNNSVEEIRAQGAFISRSEISDIMDFIREQADVNYLVDIESYMEKSIVSEGSGADDELFATIARYVVRENNASINKLQITFKVSFNRAKAIIDSLEELGVVSENQGSKARTVLVTSMELEEILSSL